MSFTSADCYVGVAVRRKRAGSRYRHRYRECPGRFAWRCPCGWKMQLEQCQACRHIPRPAIGGSAATPRPLATICSMISSSLSFCGVRAHAGGRQKQRVDIKTVDCDRISDQLLVGKLLGLYVCCSRSGSEVRRREPARSRRLAQKVKAGPVERIGCGQEVEFDSRRGRPRPPN